MKRTFGKAMLLAFVISIMLFHYASNAQSGQIESDIVLLLSSPDGVYYPDTPTSDALKRMLSDPDGYVDKISEKIVLPANLIEYPETMQAGRYEGLLLLLEAINTEASKVILRRVYLDTATDHATLNQAYRELTKDTPVEFTEEVETLRAATAAAWQLQVATLQIMGRIGDGSELKNALDRYESEYYSVKPFIEGYSRNILGVFPPSEVNIPLNGSYLMIGLPLQPPSSNYKTIFDEILLEQPPFVWSGVAYVSQEELEMGKGYWAWSRTAGNQTVIGTVVEVITLDLGEGWNLVAGPSCEFDISSIDDPGGIIEGEGNELIFGWDGQYVNPTSFEQGKGYWVKTIASGQVTLDCSAAPGKRQRAFAAFRPEENGFTSLVLRDRTGKSRMLFMGGNLPTQHRHSHALPPIPPVPDSFDARYTLGSDLVEGSLGTVVIQSSAYPVTIETAGIGQGQAMIVEEMANGQVVATRTIGPGTSFEITNPAVNALRIRIQ
ncbi:MAG: hypothetical protein R2834_18915 [Rhodothermales bacterium]